MKLLDLFEQDFESAQNAAPEIDTMIPGFEGIAKHGRDIEERVREHLLGPESDTPSTIEDVVIEIDNKNNVHVKVWFWEPEELTSDDIVGTKNVVLDRVQRVIRQFKPKQKTNYDPAKAAINRMSPTARRRSAERAAHRFSGSIGGDSSNYRG